MTHFVPTSNVYRHTSASQIFAVNIKDVGPVRRQEIFKDSEEEGTARTRVLRILQGFRLGHAIPPVHVVNGKPEYGHRFRLTHGAHRFYCSLAAGFTHVPAIQGFDINDHDA